MRLDVLDQSDVCGPLPEYDESTEYLRTKPIVDNGQQRDVKRPSSAFIHLPIRINRFLINNIDWTTKENRRPTPTGSYGFIVVPVPRNASNSSMVQQSFSSRSN